MIISVSSKAHNILIADEYVICNGCRTPDTILSKENRLFFLRCEQASSHFNLSTLLIKSWKPFKISLLRVFWTLKILWWAVSKSPRVLVLNSLLFFFFLKSLLIVIVVKIKGSAFTGVFNVLGNKHLCTHVSIVVVHFKLVILSCWWFGSCKATSG